ncbi:MAG TPA: RelA/SpoT domain-containing protein [Solirubrobacterales bacterium]
MASRYDEVRAAYVKERPLYQQLCSKCEELLRDGLRKAGVRGEIEARVKEPVSYLRKVLRDPDYLSGKRPIQDKAGLRIVLPYFNDEKAVRQVIEDRFEVDAREETVDRLGADRLGYLAVHYIVRVREGWLDEDEQTLFEGIQAEIQVGSIAQRAWAEVSHELIYKGAVDIPVEYQRIINRLVALMEVFDSEVKRAREEIATVPGFEFAPLISALDKELLRFTGRTPDRTLSQHIISQLGTAYKETPEEIFASSIEPWLTDNRERLAELYDNYGDDLEAYPLFFQPESFLIFERSENDPAGLRAAWPVEIPDQLLVSMTELWGYPVT